MTLLTPVTAILGPNGTCPVFHLHHNKAEPRRRRVCRDKRQVTRCVVCSPRERRRSPPRAHAPNSGGKESRFFGFFAEPRRCRLKVHFRLPEEADARKRRRRRRFYQRRAPADSRDVEALLCVRSMMLRLIVECPSTSSPAPSLSLSMSLSLKLQRVPKINFRDCSKKTTAVNPRPAISSFSDEAPLEGHAPGDGLERGCCVPGAQTSSLFELVEAVYGGA